MRKITLLLFLTLLAAGCVERRVYVPAYPQAGTPPQVISSPTGVSVPAATAPVIVSQAPPPPPAEVIPPAPGAGYTWIPGHWEWQNGWVWISGVWMAPPESGVLWVSGHWEHRPHGGWAYHRGYWGRHR